MEVSRFRGNEVSWHERRFIATFEGPSKSIHFAKAVLAAAKNQKFKLRVGIHTGECEIVNSNIIGSAATITECILEFASQNEVLVSGTVKDLVVGAGFKFAERERCVVEGIPGEWVVYSVE